MGKLNKFVVNYFICRYNIVGPDMVTNQLAMFAGNTEGPSQKNNIAWIWEYFHRLGYLTMHGEEDCVYKDSIKNDITRQSKGSNLQQRGNEKEKGWQVGRIRASNFKISRVIL